MNAQQESPEAYPKLSRKHAAFVTEYFAAQRNATVAYHRAYGCSLASARSGGSECLTKPNIKRAIEIEEKRLQGMRQEKLQIVLEELLKIAFSDIGDVIDLKSGRLRKHIHPNARQAIRSIEVITIASKKGKPSETRVKVRMHDKLRAID
jgi:phage terminase small subunit